MKWLLTCFFLTVGPALTAAQGYADFEGLRIGQTINEVMEVAKNRSGVKIKELPMPDAIYSLAPVIGRPANEIDVKLIVETSTPLEPAVAMVAFDNKTGTVIWLSLYPRWLGLGAFGQGLAAELVSKKYGVGQMQPDRCETFFCLVGQAETGEIIMVTPASNVRVYPPPG